MSTAVLDSPLLAARSRAATQDALSTEQARALAGSFEPSRYSPLGGFSVGVPVDIETALCRLEVHAATTSCPQAQAELAALRSYFLSRTPALVRLSLTALRLTLSWLR